jgi:hypothetical protein
VKLEPALVTARARDAALSPVGDPPLDMTPHGERARLPNA